MKRGILIFIVLIFGFCWAQEEDKIFYDEHVECFLNNASGVELIVYDSIDGSVIKTLKVPNLPLFRWYKVAIQETKDGWAKVENIMIAPVDKDSINQELRNLKNGWIKIENLLLMTIEASISDTLFIPFYEGPDVNSALVCKSGTFLILRLIETKDLWAKVSFTMDGIDYIGWVEDGYYCAYPWTACP